jgi:WD40 repeat protein
MSVVDVGTGKVLHNAIQGSQAAFAPSGKTIATVWDQFGNGRSINLWQTVAGTAIHTINLGVQQQSDDRFIALAFTPDGRAIVAANNDASVRFFEEATGGHQVTFWSHNDSCTALAISPDGRYLATAAGRHARARARGTHNRRSAPAHDGVGA